MTDVYAFPGSAAGRIVLVMDTPRVPHAGRRDRSGAGLVRPNLLYQFKIDNNGDAKEDKVIQVTFTGEGAEPAGQVRGPMAPPVQGAMENEVADVTPAVTGALDTNLGSANGIQVFAGPRDDPFFIDLEAAFCILPDRRPVGGPLSSSCALQPNGQAPFYFRNPGVELRGGLQRELDRGRAPSSLLENGAPGKLGIWGTISQ